MIERFKPMSSVVALLVVLVTAGAAAAGGQTPDFTHPTAEPSTNATLMDRTDLGNVAQTSRMLYAEGRREIKRAAKLEKKLAESDETKRAELEGKIRGARENAAAKLVESIRYNPDQLDAYTALGEVYGSLGQHQQRLQVHSTALKRQVDHQDNFRGWAEAMLELNLLGDAVQAWGHFHTANPPLADILYAEMEHWLERRQTDSAGLASEDIQRMASWLAERG